MLFVLKCLFSLGICIYNIWERQQVQYLPHLYSDNLFTAHFRTSSEILQSTTLTTIIDFSQQMAQVAEAQTIQSSRSLEINSVSTGSTFVHMSFHIISYGTLVHSSRLIAESNLGMQRPVSSKRNKRTKWNNLGESQKKSWCESILSMDEEWLPVILTGA